MCKVSVWKFFSVSRVSVNLLFCSFEVESEKVNENYYMGTLWSMVIWFKWRFTRVKPSSLTLPG